jgi:hypothetical protein
MYVQMMGMGMLIGQQKFIFITQGVEPSHFFILPMLTFNCETNKQDNQMADGDAALLLASNPSSIQSYQVLSDTLSLRANASSQPSSNLKKVSSHLHVLLFARLSLKIQSTTPLLLFLRENQQLTCL